MTAWSENGRSPPAPLRVYPQLFNLFSSVHVRQTRVIHTVCHSGTDGPIWNDVSMDSSKPRMAEEPLKMKEKVAHEEKSFARTFPME